MTSGFLLGFPPNHFIFLRVPAKANLEAMSAQTLLESKIAELRIEHRDLDDVISRLLVDPACDHLQVQRMKKRKLAIKDEINRLENRLLPDIIA
jgi:hypothetical protein